jgi:hypothetical protein
MMPGAPDRDRKLLLATVGAVVALALGVLVHGAVTNPLWQDEVASARVLLAGDLGEVLDRVRATESMPPLWYVLAWLGREAGVPVEWLRGLSVVAGAALAALLVVAARRVMPLPAAAFAGVLGAVGWQFAVHGRELRAYALYALLSLVFALVLAAAAARSTRTRLAGLAAVVAAGVLTHYFFLFVVVSGVVWLALRRARPFAFAAVGAGLVPLLAWVPSLRDQYAGGRFDWIGDFSLLKAAAFPWGVFANAGALYAEVTPTRYGAAELARVLVLVAVVAGCAVLWRRGADLYALLALGPLVLATAVWAAGPDVVNVRNLLGAAPFVALALAALVSALPPPAAIAAGAAGTALAVAGLVAAPPLGPPADRIAAEVVAAGWRPGEAVLLRGDYFDYRSPLGWYLPGRPDLRPVDDGEACEEVVLIDAAGEVGRVRGAAAGEGILLSPGGRRPACGAPPAP